MPQQAALARVLGDWSRLLWRFPMPALLAVVVLVTALDHASTLWTLAANPSAEERNVVPRWFLSHWGALGLLLWDVVKVSVAAGGLYLLSHHLRRLRLEALARWAGVAVGYGYVAGVAPSVVSNIVLGIQG